MDSFNDIFEQVLELCKNDPSLAVTTYNLFFADLIPVDFDMVNGTVTLSSPSEFKQKLVQQRPMQRRQKKQLPAISVRMNARRSAGI